MKKRIISLLLCLVLTVSLVPAAAAADTGDARTVTVRYASGHGIDTHDYEAAFTYSDDLFTKSGYTYRKDLALMSMGLAFAAYTSKDSEKTDNYATGNRNFVSMAEQCGFENIQSNKWMFQPAEADSIGISCASKTIRDNGGSYTLIAVGVRGNNYHAEWGGNARPMAGRCGPAACSPSAARRSISRRRRRPGTSSRAGIPQPASWSPSSPSSRAA